ncbi:hypothetical protein [Kordia sp.]|uniref:hypothetical protein n=1 Tax=Kordia sp. TaxID=1965332 RepID=UPI003B5A2134
MSPLGRKSLFEETNELEEKVTANFSSKKLKMHFEIHIVHNQDAFEVLRKRAKSDNYLYLYVRKKNEKEILNTKVSRLDLSGITFDDIEPLGVTLSKNVLEKLIVDKSIAKDIIHDLAEWMDINKQQYDFDRNDISILLEEHLRKYVAFKNYTPPNALELMHQVFLMCIRLGVVDLSNTTGYISDQVFGAVANYIREFKLGQETWNPNIATLQYKDIPYTNTKYDPLFSSKSSMINVFVTTMDAMFIDDIGTLNLPKHEGSEKEQQIAETIINGGINVINDIIIWFKNIIVGAFKSIQENIDHTIKLYNAYTVGFINGIIDFIASIVDGVGGLIGLLNYQNQVAITKAIDKFLAELSWEKIGEIISKKLSKLFAFLIGDEAYKNAYEFGLFIPKIFEIVLEIIGFAKGVARIANKFPKAKQFVNDKLDELINRIKLPGIDRKTLAELKNKNITVEVEYVKIQTFNVGPIKVTEKDKIIIKYKNSILKEAEIKKDPVRARKQNEGIDRYLKKLNEDPAFLNSEYVRVHRRRLRITAEFKKKDQWFIDRRDEYMKDGLVDKKVIENGVKKTIKVKGRVIDVEKIKVLWKLSGRIQKRELKGDDLTELTGIKNSRTDLESENIVKVNAKFEVDGKIVEYEYIEHSGKGIRYEGAKGVVSRKIKDNEFFDTIFEKNRSSDSESKVMELIKEDHTDLLQVAKKPENVKLLSVDLKTTYDPCIVCKKELILFNRFFNAIIRVERPFFVDEDGIKTIVKDNADFKKI